MRKALLTLLFLTGALALSAQELQEAQASPAPLFYMEHPHSVTVSTGFPFILAMMYLFTPDFVKIGICCGILNKTRLKNSP